jgi:putative chitinase
MVTTAQLQSIMPGLSTKKNGELLPFLQAAMTEFAIEAPARAAAFLAQLAHESGQFRFMEEIWGPTPAQLRYEPESSLATTLGNTEPGDGKRFKGRGPIQITGRANYRRFGDLLSVDLMSAPERAAVPDLAFRIAGLFWSKKGLNELADRATDEAFREITRRINGGFNGLPDRQKFYEVARAVLAVAAAPVSRGAVRPASVPSPAEESDFGRGREAIEADVRPEAPRKIAARTRKTKTRRAAGKTSRPKAGAQAKKRKAAAGSSGSSSRARKKSSKGGTRARKKPSRRKR